MRRGVLLERRWTSGGEPFVVAELYVAYPRQGHVAVRLGRFLTADSAAEVIASYRRHGEPLAVRRLDHPIKDDDRRALKRSLARACRSSARRAVATVPSSPAR